MISEEQMLGLWIGANMMEITTSWDKDASFAVSRSLARTASSEQRPKLMLYVAYRGFVFSN